MGASLLKVITYNGWPSSETWKKWDAWWENQVTKCTTAQTRSGQKGLSHDWHLKVKRLADVAMQATDEMVTIMAENFAQWSIEKWMWRVNLIKNILIELEILPWPTVERDNWFIAINDAGKYF